jgi:multiple sugar transport system ATP-binding protein
MTAKLELSDLRKSFDGFTAVSGLDLSLTEGEFVSLLGPSGCGKSTTLSMIAGFELPTNGAIRIDGDTVNDIAPQHRRIGLVFQDYAVFTRLKVRGNLDFGLSVRKVPRRERNRRIEEMASKLGLTEILERRGSNLNMSEMQRVALGRVLIVEPELLLLDEPMSNLDASIRSTLRSELKQIQQELKQTVLYVTHDQVEAMSMSDRIAVMRDGRLLQVGTPDEVYNHPVDRFVAEFIGDPPINVIPCTLRRESRQLAADTALHHNVPLGEVDLEPGEHLLAVRPHDLEIVDHPGSGTAETTVRLVENFGAEHVAHVVYGDQLVRVAGRPGFANAGDQVLLRMGGERVHMIDGASERVISRIGDGACA